MLGDSSSPSPLEASLLGRSRLRRLLLPYQPQQWRFLRCQLLPWLLLLLHLLMHEILNARGLRLDDNVTGCNDLPHLSAAVGKAKYDADSVVVACGLRVVVVVSPGSLTMYHRIVFGAVGTSH